MSGPTDTVHILVLCLAHTTHKHSDSCYIRVILTRFHCKKKNGGRTFSWKRESPQFFCSFGGVCTVVGIWYVCCISFYLFFRKKEKIEKIMYEWRLRKWYKPTISKRNVHICFQTWVMRKSCLELRKILCDWVLIAERHKTRWTPYFSCRAGIWTYWYCDSSIEWTNYLYWMHYFAIAQVYFAVQ